MEKSIKYLCLIGVWAILFYACKPSMPLTKIKSPREIEYGDTLHMTWNIEEADSIILDNTKSYLEPAGSLTFYPDTTTTYTFCVYRKKEVKKKRVFVEVKRPKTRYMSLPDSVNDEESFRINYGFENTRYVKIEKNADSLPANSSYELKLDTTTDITLVGYGKYDSVKITKQVKVGYVEETKCPGFIYRGQSANISWKFKNNQEVRIDGFQTPFASIDTLTISPDETQFYNIYAIRKNGDIDTFKYKLFVKSPYIQFLKAPNFVRQGDLFTIQWSAVGASFAILNGDTVPPNGVKKIKLNGSEIYTLTIYDGKIPKTREIKVHNLPQRAYVTVVDPNNLHKPGQRIDVDILAIEQSNYPKEIKLHLLMVDTSGNYISNVAPPYSTPQNTKKFFGTLTEQIMGKSYAQNFDVKEVRQDTTMFYDISLVLDHSGSMSGEIDMLQKASIAFINKKYRKDQINVVKFDNEVMTMIPLELDPKTIIDSSKFFGLDDFGGGTSLYAGTDLGIINLDTAKNEKVVVLFTDGYENSSFQHFDSLAFNASQIAYKLRKQGIRLFIISYGSNVNHDLLTKLAVLSGGKHYNILTKKDLLDVFEELPRIFRHYYELSFKPKPGEGNHHLRLTYKNQVGDLLYVETDYFIGDDWTLDEDNDDEDSLYVKAIPPSKKIVINTQTVATFDFDKDTLKMKYYPVINSYVDYLSKNPQAEALIAGHTDSKGSKEYCYDLSLRRANSVRDFLIDKGVDPNKLKVKGYGKNKLIWEDDTEEWKGWENRRVEVLIYE